MAQAQVDEKGCYARFLDERNLKLAGTDRLTRKTYVFASVRTPGTLLISTVTARQGHRQTRLSVEEARQLRDAIDLFLEDAADPATEWAYPEFDDC